MLTSKGSPSTMLTAHDLELRLVDPAKNRARFYGLTECVTLFGELCLRIVWGRLGNRRLRERSETFDNREALERRRAELLARRRQHGYLESKSEVAAPHTEQEHATAGHEMERAIVEAHGLEMQDRKARSLVKTWHAATRALRAYLAERCRDEVLDLDDVSTLASMYAVAAGVA
jgi:predicted DNA-binding WGR domain protein